ncbi:MAG: hypothetical protein A2Y13_04575 [Planctomycetes bacterium GWC2_45_44]|nr:MAG: hypothetical protein A2Y13_04575 [Planctomycetes bacterium GWC2_45_44]
MIRKNRIVIGLCVTVAATLCAVAYAEKDEKECPLSAVVQAAVKALFPNAVIEKCKMKEEEIKMYEVKVKDGNQVSEIKLADDGMVAEVETSETLATVPTAVAQALKAQGADVSKIKKGVEYAQLKLVKLDTPITTYEAKVGKGEEKIEIKVAADGKIIKQETKKKEGNKEKDGDDKDNDDND